VIDFITTDRRAFVNVTATIKNNWSYGVQAHGGFSSATSKGGIDMAAYLDGQPIDGPRRLELFSDYANDFNQVEHTGSGVQNVQVNFSIEPGHRPSSAWAGWFLDPGQTSRGAPCLRDLCANVGFHGPVPVGIRRSQEVTEVGRTLTHSIGGWPYKSNTTRGCGMSAR
jgi:hypothetical protein